MMNTYRINRRLRPAVFELALIACVLLASMLVLSTLVTGCQAVRDPNGQVTGYTPTPTFQQLTNAVGQIGVSFAPATNGLSTAVASLLIALSGGTISIASAYAHHRMTKSNPSGQAGSGSGSGGSTTGTVATKA